MFNYLKNLFTARQNQKTKFQENLTKSLNWKRQREFIRLGPIKLEKKNCVQRKATARTRQQGTRYGREGLNKSTRAARNERIRTACLESGWYIQKPNGDVVRVDHASV